MSPSPRVHSWPWASLLVLCILRVWTNVWWCVSIVIVSDGVVSLHKNPLGFPSSSISPCYCLNFWVSFKKKFKTLVCLKFRRSYSEVCSRGKGSVKSCGWASETAASSSRPLSPSPLRLGPQIDPRCGRSPGLTGLGCCRTHGYSLLQRKDMKQNQRRERSHGVISESPWGWPRRHPLPGMYPNSRHPEGNQGF